MSPPLAHKFEHILDRSLWNHDFFMQRDTETIFYSCLKVSYLWRRIADFVPASDILRPAQPEWKRLECGIKWAYGKINHYWLLEKSFTFSVWVCYYTFLWWSTSCSLSVSYGHVPQTFGIHLPPIFLFDLKNSLFVQ